MKVDRRRLTTLFNVAASTVLVAVSSVVMAKLITSDPDAAVNFAPFYVVILSLLGGYLFAGRGGKWITIKVVIQAVLIFLVLPLGIFFYAVHLANTPAPRNPDDRREVSDLFTNNPHFRK